MSPPISWVQQYCGLKRCFENVSAGNDLHRWCSGRRSNKWSWFTLPAVQTNLWLLLMTGHAAQYWTRMFSDELMWKSSSLSMDTYSKDWSCLFCSTEQKHEAFWLLTQAHIWSDSDRYSIFAGGIVFLTQMSSPTNGDILCLLDTSFGHVIPWSRCAGVGPTATDAGHLRGRSNAHPPQWWLNIQDSGCLVKLTHMLTSKRDEWQQVKIFKKSQWRRFSSLIVLFASTR